MQQALREAQRDGDGGVEVDPDHVLLKAVAVYDGQEMNASISGLTGSCAAISGTVEVVGSSVDSTGTGDIVATLYPDRQDRPDGKTGISGNVVSCPANSLVSIPEGSSTNAYLALIRVFWSAAAVLQQELELPILKPSADRNEGFRLYGRRIIIVGGETPLAAAMVKVLRTSAPDIKSIVTSFMPDQRQLLERTIALVQLGATFAIDGAAPELLDELREVMEGYMGVDVIIDTNGRLHEQDELPSLLIGERKIIDCAQIDARLTMWNMLKAERDLVAHIGRLARESQELPSPGLDDE